MVAEVEKAIRNANLGFNPITDGQNLRIPMPDLNEERRKELVKLAGTYAENAKVAIRHVRRDGMDGLKKAEKDGDLGKDDAHAQSENVQKATDDVTKEIDVLLADKEKEIMTV
jgi:ribosome recycling factor